MFPQQANSRMGTTAAEPVRTVEPTEHPILAWFQARQKPMAIAAGVVFILGLAGWYVVESGRRKQAQALSALDLARSSMDAGNYPEASTGFQKVAQNYSGTDAAYEAALALNQVRMLSGQSQLAVEDLRKLVASNPPAPYGAAAHTHLAMALENTGQAADAAAEYLKAAALAPEAFRKIDALLGAARSYRSIGKETEAAAVLSDLIKKYPKETAGIAEAEVRLAEITKGR